MQPFHPHRLPEYFEGWEYYDYYQCYIDQTEERNLIKFEESGYVINAQMFEKPATLNDFIEDCLIAGVKLLWSESMADKLWLRQFPEKSMQ